jgi:hypothetical protein
MTMAFRVMAAAALRGPLDEAGWLALADACEEGGRPQDALAVRQTWEGLQPVLAARELLRTQGLVEPQCLRLNDVGGWYWCVYLALPGHPNPGNAGHGYTHPADIELMGRRSLELTGSLPAARRWLRAGRRRLQSRDDIAGVVLMAVVRSLGMAAANIGHATDGDEVFFVDFERK